MQLVCILFARSRKSVYSFHIFNTLWKLRRAETIYVFSMLCLLTPVSTQIYGTRASNALPPRGETRETKFWRTATIFSGFDRPLFLLSRDENELGCSNVYFHGSAIYPWKKSPLNHPRRYFLAFWISFNTFRRCRNIVSPVDSLSRAIDAYRRSLNTINTWLLDCPHRWVKGIILYDEK